MVDNKHPTTPYEARPGNYGGETLREYCGLSKHRRTYYTGKLEVARIGEPITAQRLYAAIRRHVQWAKWATFDKTNDNE